MKAFAFILGIILMWPAFLMIAAHMEYNMRPGQVWKTAVLTIVALALFAYGAADLPSGGDSDSGPPTYCGSGPTRWEC